MEVLAISWGQLAAFITASITSLAWVYKLIEKKFDRVNFDIKDSLKEMKDFRKEVNARFEKTDRDIKDFRKEVDARFEKVDARFEKVDARFQKVDHDIKDFRKEVDLKFSRTDDKIEHLGDRVGKVENRLTAIETTISYIAPRKVIPFPIEEDHSEKKANEG
ncbi:hypothetical protein [Candidatus Neptunochlamydia vexilliferae]|uniref:Uncharacterized protein n=1 Tax=Candidatus Neptunichlamydia vexilliferae TaxID=1651774 RepID=A0ABS0AYH1_9BACT|nr:hypothetical protein [Candidatus Neptunochlamydia vexilliferae]MBF5059168.1 hypothetical protein [Candidatus Neptunochlamydia vexilliferae]